MSAKPFFMIMALLIGVAGAGSVCAVEPIRIAAVFSKTGIASLELSYNFRGVSMAVTEINEAGGVLGRPLEVIELDNQGTALGSQANAEEAVKLGVAAVIGSAWSSHSLAMAPVLQQAQIPMITNISTNPDVTKVGDYIFRVCFIDPFQGKIMAHFAHNDLGAKTAAVLTDVSNQYSMGLSDYFIRDFTEIGGKLVYQGRYIQKDVDFSAMLKEMRQQEPDVIFLPGYSRDSGLVITQARDMGIKTTFLGGDGWGTLIHDIVGDVIEGSYFCGHTHRQSPFPLNLRIREHYRNQYGGEIPIEGLILAYDATYLLADAIRRAGSSEPAKIREALAATRDFKTATGTITFDENGDPKNKDAVIFKFEKGAVAFIKTIRPDVKAVK